MRDVRRRGLACIAAAVLVLVGCGETVAEATEEGSGLLDEALSEGTTNLGEAIDLGGAATAFDDTVGAALGGGGPRDRMPVSIDGGSLGLDGTALAGADGRAGSGSPAERPEWQRLDDHVVQPGPGSPGFVGPPAPARPPSAPTRVAMVYPSASDGSDNDAQHSNFGDDDEPPAPVVRSQPAVVRAPEVPRPTDFGEGGRIRSAQEYWDSVPDQLAEEVSAGRMGPMEATLRHTGAKVMGGLLSLSNLGGVEESAGELGYDVASGADGMTIAKDVGSLALDSALAGATFLPATQLAKGGSLGRSAAGGFDDMTIHLRPDQYAKVREGGGLIPTAEGRVFGSEYNTLRNADGTINRLRQVGSGLTNPAARTERVVIGGDALQNFERITPGGIIGASKRFGGQIVSKDIGHNIRFDPARTFEVIDRTTGAKTLYVFAAESQKAGFKEYMKAQLRQAGTVAKEVALTGPPTVLAADAAVESMTGQEAVFMGPVYEATGKVMEGAGNLYDGVVGP